jgi:ribosomal protein S18 acetylase RimI-like enzyme
VSAEISLRPARKSDASEIALLVNIATHGGIANGWSHDDEAAEAYDPIEIGRLQMLKDDGSFNWRNATMAESDGEVVGMLLGYREPDEPGPTPADTPDFFRPLLELEAEARGRWFISMLGVHMHWRSRGVGSKLLDAAEEHRDATAAHGLALIVEDVNEDARRLYERRGFAVGAKRPMRAFPGASAPGKDWLLMVKE